MHHSRALIVSAFALAAIIVNAGCDGGGSPNGPVGPPPPVTIDGYTITVRPGVIDYGSGVTSVAVLAAVRDVAGEGPSSPWAAALHGREGYLDSPRLSYNAPGPGSYVAWGWPDLHLQDDDAYELRIGPSFAALTPFDLGVDPRSSIGVPGPHLSLDGARIEWAPVTGAAAYECSVEEASTGDTVVETRGTDTACDLSTLPPGEYDATVMATSVNLAALAASTARAPALPARFDVAVARLGVYLPYPDEELDMPVQVRTAGGALRVGDERRLVVWASVTTPDGAPPGQDWLMNLQVWEDGWPWSFGSFTYPAGARQFLHVGFHSAPVVAQYDVRASSFGPSVSTRFNFGAPAELPEPRNVAVSADGGGAASVSWGAVAGARSHLVRAYDPATGDLVAEAWTKASPLAFPTGSFVAGATYDVYVLATDADLIDGGLPLQVAATETAAPATFTAR
jgi:hypothetical protein